MYTVYILYSKSHDSFYIGYTTDIEIRISQHNDGLTVSTRNKRPWIVVYTEQYNDHIDAIRRERFLKNQRNKSFYKRISNLV
jgi:putative endonuclease